MTHVIRSHLPGGQPILTVRLSCDGCRRWGPGPLGTALGAEVGLLRSLLRIAARIQYDWATVSSIESAIRAGGSDAIVGVDLCPGCRHLAPRRASAT